MAPGLTEILIVVVIIVLLFGAKRIPGLARGLGKSVTSFKAGLREEPESEKVEDDSETEKKTS